MMSFTDVLVCSLAVWEAIEIWRHGSITADWRDRVSTWDDGWFRSLLRCSFCLSPWVALLSISMLLCHFGVIIYALAIARLANLGNDLTYAWCRTPKTDQTLPVTDDLNPIEKEP